MLLYLNGLQLLEQFQVDSFEVESLDLPDLDVLQPREHIHQIRHQRDLGNANKEEFSEATELELLLRELSLQLGSNLLVLLNL